MKRQGFPDRPLSLDYWNCLGSGAEHALCFGGKSLLKK
jgi:hypothetical protein